MTNRAPLRLLLAVAVILSASAAGAADSPWRDLDDAALRADAERVIVPQRYRALRLDRDALMETLAQAPLEFTADAADKALSVVVALPMPDGTSLRFRVEESPIMEPGLAAQFPDIKTYRGQGLDDGTATPASGGRRRGFHAIVLAERGTVYIDPYRRGDTAHYVSFFKRDYRAPAGDTFRCLLDEADAAFDGPDAPPALAPSGSTLRTYRLALATTVEYSDFHSMQNPPSKADVMNNGLIPTMNRVNGVYERDVALRMVMVANNDLIIYVVEPDPYTNGNGVAPCSARTRPTSTTSSATRTTTSATCSAPAAAAWPRCACPASPASKARGVTGRGQPIGDPFDIDYVAHEMGHQFGGNHTFNGNAGACAGGNRNGRHRLRAGQRLHHHGLRRICGGADLQPNSDDYFHTISFVEIQAYSHEPATGNSCAGARRPPATRPRWWTPGPTFTIPSRTPFTLTASGSDPDGDPLTYIWEEFDLGPAGAGNTDNGVLADLALVQLHASSPRARSRSCPTSSTTSPPTARSLPTTKRTMTFRVTARDNRAGGGGVDWDATSVSVIGDRGAVPGHRAQHQRDLAPGQRRRPSPGTWPAPTAAPITTANVQILLSTDGGLTFPTVARRQHPERRVGRRSRCPAVTTTTARVKVAAVGNVFFDMSNANFSIQPGTCGTITINPPTIPAGTAGSPYSVTFTQTGGLGPITWSVTGTLPTGITLNPSTGVLSGTPTQHGSFPISVIATDNASCSGLRAYTLVINRAGPFVPLALAVDVPGNRVFEPGETVVVAPSWRNDTGAAETLTGLASAFTGPAGPTYTLVDATAVYGTVAAGGTGTCATADCYQVAVSNPAPRPVVHWDATMLETLPSGDSKTWTLHIGRSFTDVQGGAFLRFIETLLHRDVTGGCTATSYCPAARLRASRWRSSCSSPRKPPATPRRPAAPRRCSPTCPSSSPFCRWVEELARRGVVSGCGGGNYCPACWPRASRWRSSCCARWIPPSPRPPAGYRCSPTCPRRARSAAGSRSWRAAASSAAAAAGTTAPRSRSRASR